MNAAMFPLKDPRSAVLLIALIAIAACGRNAGFGALAIGTDGGGLVVFEGEAEGEGEGLIGFEGEAEGERGPGEEGEGPAEEGTVEGERGLSSMMHGMMTYAEFAAQANPPLHKPEKMLSRQGLQLSVQGLQEVCEMVSWTPMSVSSAPQIFP